MSTKAATRSHKGVMKVSPCRFFNFSCKEPGKYSLWCGRPSEKPCYIPDCIALTGRINHG